MNCKLFISVILLAIKLDVVAQPVAKGTEMQELVWISEVYGRVPNLSFSLKYSYTDSLYPATVLDSMVMNCKISRGKSYTYNNDVEYLQGREFNVYVNKEDSFVMVTPGQEYKNFFKVPLLDSNFRKAHIADMGTWTINDSTRKLCIAFRPESYYVNYTLLYDPRSGLVKSISFCTRNPYGMYDVPSNHILKTTLTMTGFSTSALDASLFNENKYFYRSNGQLFLQPSWTGYRLQQ